MYRNLEAELARQNITKKELATKLGKTPTTMCLKLNGKANLTLKECIEIKNVLHTSMSIEELFYTAV